MGRQKTNTLPDPAEARHSMFDEVHVIKLYCDIVRVRVYHGDTIEGSCYLHVHECRRLIHK
jgi:hypothetical protein